MFLIFFLRLPLTLYIPLNIIVINHIINFEYLLMYVYVHSALLFINMLFSSMLCYHPFDPASFKTIPVGYLKGYLTD